MTSQIDAQALRERVSNRPETIMDTHGFPVAFHQLTEQEIEDSLKTFSDKQRLACHYSSQGFQTKEIAERCGLTILTLRTYLEKNSLLKDCLYSMRVLNRSIGIESIKELAKHDALGVFQSIKDTALLPLTADSPAAMHTVRLDASREVLKLGGAYALDPGEGWDFSLEVLRFRGKITGNNPAA